MATLSVSSVLGTGITTLNKLVLGASDTFTYVSGTGQILELNNPTGGSLTAVVKGLLQVQPTLFLVQVQLLI